MDKRQENKSFRVSNKMFGSLNSKKNANIGGDIDVDEFNGKNMLANDLNYNNQTTAELDSTIFEDNYSITQSNQQPNNKRKLSTLSGVFSPVALSMFSVLLFLRLGFVIGQAGLIQALIQYVLAYFILMTTVLSIAAVSTNGAVEGGGAYFMISRTLGPEFGGSIGIIFFFANVFSSALYSVGCAEALIESFGPGGTYAPQETNSKPNDNNYDIFSNFATVTTLPDSLWWSILYASGVNLLNLIMCLFGSSTFARASLGVLCAICLCGLSIPISLIIKTQPECIEIPRNNIIVYPPLLPNPFINISHINVTTYTAASADIMTSTISATLTSSVAPLTFINTTTPVNNYTPSVLPINISDIVVKCGNYTGFNFQTFISNLKPFYSVDYTTGLTATFMTVFAVIFSGATGIMAGANMSGDLKDPQKSIPKGTLLAVAFTFTTYIVLSFLVGASCTGFLLRNNYMVLAHINVWSPFITIGILLATFTAGLSNMIGASRILEAVARDKIFGTVFTFLTKTTQGGNPIASVIVTWILVQVAIIMGGGSLNKIAGIVSVFFLLSYLAINISCCAMDLASTPNFRPSFKYFSWQTALLGSLSCFFVMFAVTPTFSLVGLLICGLLVGILHWKTPASSWGSLSQALIFHQVRKYLLKLDPRKEHVKYWRPQILQLISHPKVSCELIDFSNDLKKSGLFVLGHVFPDTLTTQNGMSNTTTNDPIESYMTQWLTLVGALKVKAFVELTAARSVREGSRQLIRLSGLGAMKPNIVILGFPDDETFLHGGSVKISRRIHQTISPLFQKLCLNKPELQEYFNTEYLDENSEEKSSQQRNNLPKISTEDYVGLINDCLVMGKAVILARNFENFDKQLILTGSSLNGFKYYQQNIFADSSFSTSIFSRTTLRQLIGLIGQSSICGGRGQLRKNLRCFIDVWPQNFFEQPRCNCRNRTLNGLRDGILCRCHHLNLQDSGILFILQLACVLNMKREWNKNSLLRVMLCLEQNDDLYHDHEGGSRMTDRRRFNGTATTNTTTAIDLGGGDSTILFNGEAKDSATMVNKFHQSSGIHMEVVINELKVLLAKLRIPARVKVVPWAPSRLFPATATTSTPLLAFTDTKQPQQHGGLLPPSSSISSPPSSEYLSYVNTVLKKHSKISPFSTAHNNEDAILSKGSDGSNTTHSFVKGFNNAADSNLMNEPHTAVCFLYLPKPPVSPPHNTNFKVSQESSSSSSSLLNALNRDYLEKLEILTRDLPPTCLIYGCKTVTTTSL